MRKNSSLWTKFDPLTTNIFWIYNWNSLDISVLLIINLNTNVIWEAKNHLIFPKTSILQEKFEFFCKIWVVDAGYLDLTNCFYFFTVISAFDTAYLCFFVIHLSAVALLCLIKVLIVLIPWVKTWHIHLYH